MQTLSSKQFNKRLTESKQRCIDRYKGPVTAKEMYDWKYKYKGWFVNEYYR